MNLSPKLYLVQFISFLVIGLSSLGAKADAFVFAVAGVAPNSYYTKLVAVDVAEWTQLCPHGWRNFYLNIDGYNYPINNWNALATSPNSVRAWFSIPNNFVGYHRMQLIVEAWGSPYYGYPVPIGTFYSYPQFYLF